MKAFVVGMTPYIPLTQHPGGFAEYSTAPPWKPFYVGNVLQKAALIEAYLTGDSYNYAIGKNSPNTLILPFLYRPGMIATNAPDHLMVYDRNILGPRGRFGPWGVVGTTRDPSQPGPEVEETPTPGMVGLNTFVGAYLLKNPESPDLEAAFHGACPEVKLKPGTEADFNRGDTWSYLTGSNVHSAVSKSRLVYGLSTRYPIHQRKGGWTPEANTGWEGVQAWVVTPERVMGLSSITTGQAHNVYGLAQRIALFSHRGTCQPGDGKAQALVANGGNAWSYGGLRITLHASDFRGTPETFYYGLMANYSGILSTGDQGSAMLVLHDEHSGRDERHDYPPGTTRSALIEITHAGASDSTEVAQLTLPAGLRGFEFNEAAGRKIRMVHNITAEPIPYSGSMTAPYPSARMVESWDDTASLPLIVSSGNLSIPLTTIPAYGNLLIIDSGIAVDQSTGHSEYKDCFPGL